MVHEVGTAPCAGEGRGQMRLLDCMPLPLGTSYQGPCHCHLIEGRCEVGGDGHIIPESLQLQGVLCNASFKLLCHSLAFPGLSQQARGARYAAAGIHGCLVCGTDGPEGSCRNETKQNVNGFMTQKCSTVSSTTDFSLRRGRGKLHE